MELTHPEPLSKLETQVLERLRDGRPDRLPTEKREEVYESIRRKGFGDEL